MGGIAQVTIKYGNESKVLKFNGNFGFQLGNKKYKVQNGVVMTESGNRVTSLKMSKAMAYQLLGMSNTAYESEKSYTFDSNDFMALNQEAQSSHLSANGETEPLFAYNTKMRIGNGIDADKKDVKFNEKENKFSTSYQYKGDSGKNRISNVSIWKTK